MPASTSALVAALVGWLAQDQDLRALPRLLAPGQPQAGGFGFELDEAHFICEQQQDVGTIDEWSCRRPPRWASEKPGRIGPTALASQTCQIKDAGHTARPTQSMKASGGFFS
jgi:hypothetical protein